ncbi:MAG: TolB family protein [Bacillota bacterium]
MGQLNPLGIHRSFPILVQTLGLIMLLGTVPIWAAPVGIFDDHGDIGQTAKAGAVQYDAEHQTYLVAGGGENMWAKQDAFHFVWKRLSGDVTLTADIRWPQAGGNAHRKACLIIRQSLDADSAYADAAVHGDGLTSLQYRPAPGEVTSEIQSNVTQPTRVRIEKQGDVVFMSIAKPGQSLQHAGGTFKLKLKEPFYVGLGVCAHDNAAIEQALFSNVQLSNEKHPVAEKLAVESTLEIVDIASKDRRVVYQTSGRIEAPNWSPDGKFLYFNAKGRMFKLPRTGGEPQMINTAFADRCNNDHGISPDGTQLAISHHGAGGKSLIYVLPIGGGEPRQVTPLGPSYWHGWSPDGKTLVYCAERGGEFDVYAIPAAGGQEKRLTTAPGLDDGPEYTPDGKWIYFNSVRTGLMQIWRMKPDGSSQEQVTSDDYNNWFAHPSPNGKWIVMLSYEKEVKEHPADKDVMLRLMPINGGPIQVLAKVFGGQGTINVPSWSPDSRYVAFVSYQLVNP